MTNPAGNPCPRCEGCGQLAECGGDGLRKPQPAPSAQPSITCPRCQRTSHHPKDIEEGYCGNCHDWTGPSSVGHFLNLIKADPHLLPPAPVVVEASDIDRRRSEGHTCHRCGQPAYLTYAVAIRDNPEAGKWWLDLCNSCGRWLHRGLVGKPLEDEWGTAVEQAGGLATE